MPRLRTQYVVGAEVLAREGLNRCRYTMACADSLAGGRFGPVFFLFCIMTWGRFLCCAQVA
ncbi:hypothetical protein KL86DES1_20841 [uncultured Desulfovibrio sp.]|uniref:Uncharacterized protein n=1 Tax=uncultured Desulfovibrio sp. TaxID=167968 RepID=A0A212L5D7_9BACT|nr:hypothetical protein KL86DES1_20841 [uncultured Desulfovibrio sp.]VZH33744.1 conserved protein of unknown function [Desulfovibrio sp. 86]